MKKIDLRPLELLIQKHEVHKGKYKVDFRGMEISIYPGVLNPNYTKVSGFLCDNIIIPMSSKVLDMFCGSGALGLFHAKYAFSIMGIDISSDAIECSRENAKNLLLENKTEYRISDVWSSVLAEESFDIIIANPPLLPVSPRTDFEKNFADSESMDITRRFIEGIPKHLEISGEAYVATSTASDLMFKEVAQNLVIKVATEVGLKSEIVAELNPGYEIYKIIKLSF